ncbi:MAG: S-methyl-5'-thioadenosine phosphorylase [Ardenticatenales bacterium]|nr:S-methyl-5'-thioadenosine phosphorylase [Ardenticatenales bacterium]
MKAEPVAIGVIGGSGLYEMEGLSDIEEVWLSTPFGDPSDVFIVGTLHGQRIAFLPRHGRGHRIAPSEVNSRANIYGLKALGCRWVIGVCACGSLREEYAPGHIIIPDGLFDHTKERALSFFGGGIVAHLSLADPFCPVLSEVLYEAVEATGATVHRGGDFIVIEGPRFSTKTESRVYRKWGMDLIGMTAVPEAQLAREAELSYAIMAHVTDYDVWHEAEEPVTLEKVIATLMKNVGHAKAAIQQAVPLLADKESPCWDGIKDAVLTNPALFPRETRERLGILLDKYFPGAS